MFEDLPCNSKIFLIISAFQVMKFPYESANLHGIEEKFTVDYLSEADVSCKCGIGKVNFSLFLGSRFKHIAEMDSIYPSDEASTAGFPLS